jgi:hypothetical protein
LVCELKGARAVYPLTAAQFVEFHEKGITEAVLDYDDCQSR